MYISPILQEPWHTPGFNFPCLQCKFRWKTACVYNNSIDCDGNSLLAVLKDPIKDCIFEWIKLMIRCRMVWLDGVLWSGMKLEEASFFHPLSKFEREMFNTLAACALLMPLLHISPSILMKTSFCIQCSDGEVSCLHNQCASSMVFTNQFNKMSVCNAFSCWSVEKGGCCPQETIAPFFYAKTSYIAVVLIGIFKLKKDLSILFGIMSFLKDTYWHISTLLNPDRYSWKILEPAYRRATYKINVLLNKHNSYYYNFTLINVFPTLEMACIKKFLLARLHTWTKNWSKSTVANSRILDPLDCILKVLM